MKKSKNKKSALFLDRDGVIIEDTAYPSKISDVKIIPEIIPLIKHANALDLKVVVVSNQAGIAKGYYTEEDYFAVTKFLNQALLRSEAVVDAWYFCPYHPQGSVEKYTKDSEFRKPRPGMLLLAAKEHNLDLSDSIMIGDKVSDVIPIAGLRNYLIQGKYKLDDAPIKELVRVYLNHQLLLADFLAGKL